MLQQALLFLHVMGAIVLLGTGAGIAFFMLMAHRTGDARLIAHVAGTVVIADTIFTATAALLQPLTGFALAWSIGWPLSTGWIVLALALYLFVGACWLPVVWIQMRLRDLARAAMTAETAPPLEYHRLFRMWFALGIPAFLSMLAIIWLMLFKPDFAIPFI